MLNSKTLNEVVRDPKKTLFISKSKINLTFCDIETIDQVHKSLSEIKNLHLSHNKIVNLNGIQQFKSITHLSLSYNHLKDWTELLKVRNKEALVELNVKGNPFTAHPNHLFLIIEKFPNLQRIDDLKISKEDRYYLKNYWLLSGKILPFFIQLKSDLAVIEDYLQRMKLTAEIRGRETFKSHHERRENIAKLEDLYLKMTEELRNKQFLVEIHRTLEKYNKFQSQSPTLSLRILDTLIQGLYENRLEHLIFERKDLYVNYRKLFNDLLLRYFSIHDVSVDRFLTQQVVESSSYDHWKFAEDSDYAFDCVLYEFYKLMPNQASISHNLNFTFSTNEVEKQEGLYENPRDKVITSLDVGPNNPDFLRNICITHFPVFPLNLQYNNMLLKTLLSQLQVIENVAVDIYMLLGSNSPVLKNLGTYRSFLEARLQAEIAGTRSQTPPDYRHHENEIDTDVQLGSGTKRMTASMSPKQRQIDENHGSLSTLGLLSSERKLQNSKRHFYLIPKSPKTDNMTSLVRTKRQSPARVRFDSNTDGLSTAITHSNRYNDSKGIQTEKEQVNLSKTKNVLPLLMIVKFDADFKFKLKEGFFSIKAHSKAQRKIQRKQIVEQFYSHIKENLGKTLKNRIIQAWRKRAQSKGNFMAHLRKIRRKRLAKFFRLLDVGCQRNRYEVESYYIKNLSLKVFYSILQLRMKKRASLRKVIENLIPKKHRIMNLYLSKWRLVNSAMKYSIRKTSIASRSVSALLTMRKGQSSEDTKRYKNLREETQRLQTKKTMRELQPYFSKDHDIFRKCSACDYEI